MAKVGTGLVGSRPFAVVGVVVGRICGVGPDGDGVRWIRAEGRCCIAANSGCCKGDVGPGECEVYPDPAERGGVSEAVHNPELITIMLHNRFLTACSSGIKVKNLRDVRAATIVLRLRLGTDGPYYWRIEHCSTSSSSKASSPDAGHTGFTTRNCNDTSLVDGYEGLSRSDLIGWSDGWKSGHPLGRHGGRRDDELWDRTGYGVQRASPKTRRSA